MELRKEKSRKVGRKSRKFSVELRSHEKTVSKRESSQLGC